MAERDSGYDFIRAVAIAFIVVFHFILCFEEATGADAPLVIKMLTSGSCRMGALGVAWFFILSGSVLHKKYADGVAPWLFYKKRVLRLFIPLWIAYPFFYIASYPANPEIGGEPFHSVLSSLLGMDFYYLYFTGTQDLLLVGEWFTSVIITLYLLFPLLHFLFSRRRKSVTIAMLFLFALNLRLEILTTNDGFRSVVNALVFFWLGMLFETYKGIIAKSRVLPWTSLILAGIVFVRFRHGILGFSYLSTFFFAIFSYTSAYHFSSIFRPAYPIVRYLSKFNYEIYLTHHRVYFLLIPVFLNKNSNGLAVIFMFITTTVVILLLSEKLSVLSAMIQRRRGNVGKNQDHGNGCTKNLEKKRYLGAETL